MTSTLQRASALSAELQTLLERAAWVVLVGPLPEAQEERLLELATQGQSPVLLIDPRLEPEADLRSRLEQGVFTNLALCQELLAAEATEQPWYRFNDARRNGIASPDQLQQQWPNLRLESVELRPARRLDELVSAWLAQGEAEAQEPGLIWMPAQQACTVLAGAGALLDRLDAIWLEGPADPGGLDAELVNRLEGTCHRLMHAGPGHQLWQRDRQSLMQRQLLDLTHQREALQTQVVELQGQLSAQSAQTLEQSQQREVLQTQVEELQGQLSAQSAQTLEQSEQREVLQTQVEELQGHQAALRVC